MNKNKRQKHKKCCRTKNNLWPNVSINIFVGDICCILVCICLCVKLENLVTFVLLLHRIHTQSKLFVGAHLKKKVRRLFCIYFKLLISPIESIIFQYHSSLLDIAKSFIFSYVKHCPHVTLDSREYNRFVLYFGEVFTQFSTNETGICCFKWFLKLNGNTLSPFFGFTLFTTMKATIYSQMFIFGYLYFLMKKNE